MSFTETLVILVVAMIVLGPRKLPEAARKLGRWMGMVRRAGDEFKRQIMSMDQAVEDNLNTAAGNLDRLVPNDEELAKQVNDTLDEVERAYGEPPAFTTDEMWEREQVPGGILPDPPEPEAPPAQPAPEPAPAQPPAAAGRQGGGGAAPAPSAPAEAAAPRLVGLAPTAAPAAAKEVRRG